MNASRDNSSSMHRLLALLRRRQRWRRGLLWAGRGAFYGALLAAGCATILSLVQPEWVRTGLWLAALWIPVASLASLFIGSLWPVDNLRVSRALDLAAAGDDRFASAVQLANHKRRDRARLLLEDALSAVGSTPVQRALPLRAAPELKWSVLPALVAVLLLGLISGPQHTTQAAAPPEISPEEWTELSNELHDQMQQWPVPEDEEERALREELEQFAKLLEQNPDKKDALSELARLRSKLDERRQASGMPNLSLRQAARAMRTSASLRQFANMMQNGEYDKAAAELQALAERLKSGNEKMTAADFEAGAADFERLTQQTLSMQELNENCNNCANAAASMNRNKLAEALNKLAMQLQKNAQCMKQCDSCCRASSLLDTLRRRLSQMGCCSKCNGKGCSECGGNSPFVQRSNKKGGLKAGWGTADNWKGGMLTSEGEERMPDVVAAQENPGEQNVYPTVSPYEQARSTQEYRERYADLVQKAEADLALERVPLAMRDYLRKYFTAIRPSDDPVESEEE